MAGITQQIVRQNAPSFGVHYTNDIFNIKPNEVYRAVNCHLTEDGVLLKRRGKRLLNTTALDGAVTSIFDYRRPDGSSYKQHTLVTAGDVLYKYDYVTEKFEKLADLNSTARPTWATFKGSDGGSYAFMANGTDFIKYDGSYVTAVTFVTDISAPRYILSYDDRLLATGCDSDPYVVFVSDSLDGDTWEYGDSPAASYWTMQNIMGDRITGIKQIYSFCAIFQQFGITIITGANPDSDTTEQIPISKEYGTTSHWSIQTVGNMMYFCDETNVYRAVLRDAIENGLVVTPISSNIRQKYNDIRNHTDIVSIYNANHGSIYWGTDSKVGSRKDTVLVYSLWASGDKGEMGYVDVWSGWFDGWEPYSFGAVYNTNGGSDMWMGDEDGYVFVCLEDNQYKDEDHAGNGTIIQNGYKDATVNSTNVSGGTYTTTRDNENGTSTNTTYLSVGQLYQSTYYYNFRSFLTFDIPNVVGLTPTSCSLKLYGNYDFSTTDSEIYIVTATDYTDDPTIDDYSHFDGYGAGAAFTGTVLNDTWDMGDFATTWNTFDFNDDGLTALATAAGSTLKLCLLSKNDYNATAPTDSEYVRFYTSSSGAYVPYLSIVYTVNDVEEEIITAPLYPSGITIEKRGRFATPILYQKHDSSVTVQWLIDGTYLKPSDGRTISLKNLVPYWRASDSTTFTSTWNNIVWNDRPYIVRPVTIDEPFRYIQFRFYNAGSNDTDEVAYAGLELVYQRHGIARTQG